MADGGVGDDRGSARDRFGGWNGGLGERDRGDGAANGGWRAHWTKCAVPNGDKDGATLDFRGVQAWDEKSRL